MNEIRGKSIWDDIPEDWKEPQSPVAEAPEEAALPPAPVQEQTGETEAAAELLPAGEAPAKPVSEKKKYQEFERRNAENRRNASENSQKAYREEEKGNRRDFIILGIVLFLAAGAIAALIIASSRLSTERVYDLIEQGNYSTAYQDLTELAAEGENIDKLVYAFCEACAADSEYKRAVAALEYLSPAAENNTAFFESLVETMLSHGKVNRAGDVLAYMREHGTVLSRLADQLAEKYEELS